MSTDLPLVPLGRTGMDITRVGFGAWAVGGGGWAAGWGPQDDDESISAIRRAVESGVNWIDTAGVYGLGHSEEVVARALSVFSDADRPFVFTKGGLVWDEENRTERPKRIASAESLRADAQASLRRLGVERIDLFQLHWPAEDGTSIEDYWQTFLELKAEGVVRAVGLSNHFAEQLARAEAVGHVDTLQPSFSAINTAVADETLPWCADHETGVIVYSPMGSGLLTGAFTAERVASLPDDDWRRSNPSFTTNLEANLAIAAGMARVAERRGVPTPAVAAAWTLGFRGVSAAIVGARSAEQVDGWIPAASLSLTAEEYAEILPSRVP